MFYLSYPGKTGCICPTSVLLYVYSFTGSELFESKYFLRILKLNYVFQRTTSVVCSKPQWGDPFQLICGFTDMLSTNKCRGKTFLS